MGQYKSIAEHIVDAIWTDLMDRNGILNGLDTAMEQEIVDDLIKIAEHELDFAAGAYQKKNKKK